MALEPKTGRVVWKYDVGPKPEPLDPPITIKDSFGDHVFYFGPATSSIWSTPSFDAESGTIFFGTDVNTAPRRPTADDPRLYTRESCAVIALDVRDGAERWVTQINPGDVWTNAMRAYDPKEGRYKDQSIGDTPKIYTIPLEGKPTKVVGVGCKNGGFYVLRAADGRSRGPHAHLHRPADVSALAGAGPRGCSPCRAASAACRRAARPTARRSSPTASTPFGSRRRRSHVRAQRRAADGRARGGHQPGHARPSAGGTSGPRSPSIGGPPPKPVFTRRRRPGRLGHRRGQRRRLFHDRRQRQAGRPRCGHGRAPQGDRPRAGLVGPLGLARPRLRRHRQYPVHPSDFEAFFPKKYTGVLYSFGLPGEDEVSRLVQERNRGEDKVRSTRSFFVPAFAQ